MSEPSADYSDATSSADGSPVAAEPRRLSLWDSICLIVGIIIGASIYQSSQYVFQSAGSASMGMAAWAVGGIVSLIGALCYAELASAYRTAGGDYTYLTRAYGSKVGFVFAWAELSVIRTGGSIAFMAYIFAKYASEFCPLGPGLAPYSKLIYALLGIIGLTFINAVGVRPGRLVQNVLTSANIIGLTSIAIIGLIWYLLPNPGPAASDRAAVDVAAAVGAATNPLTAASTVPTLPEAFELSFALTMVWVFYAYGGWNEAAFIASEVKNPKRNIRRALMLGTLLVTVIYMAVNLAYIGALGYWGVCKSETIAADMFALPFGEFGRADIGRKIISALVMVSALGSIHGLLFTGMRLYGTFGRDHQLFAWLAGKEDKTHSNGALFAQAAFSILLIAVVELAYHWRVILCQVAGYCGIELDAGFQTQGDIYRLVACTAPVFWLFFLLTACSLFVLRWRDPNIERPYLVPLYPVLPLIFVLSCAFMLYKSSAYALKQQPAEALIVFGLMLIGVPLGIWSARARVKYQQSES
ncbi:MAG TPA: amino acid permease [Gemmataceae bacterium]|jgi:amino acid transporter|nr:amino acid permease [Gemmataceae bacterium]